MSSVTSTTDPNLSKAIQFLVEMKVILVTGCNQGIGRGIVERLISDQFSSFPPTRNVSTSGDLKLKIIMACRSTPKAEATRLEIINSLLIRRKWGWNNLKTVDELSMIGRELLPIITVDLANPTSIFAACRQIKNEFKSINTFIFNAGYMPIERMIFSYGIYNMFTDPVYLMKTGGDMMVQRIGEVTKDGIGLCFMANVLGHYIMLRELEGLLQATEDGEARVIWVGSSTGMPKFFDINDMHCLRGKHPYESSKRLLDLLILKLSPMYRLQVPFSDTASAANVHSVTSPIHMFTTSPGSVATNIIGYPMLTFLFVVNFFIMRLCGFTGSTGTPFYAATAYLYLTNYVAIGELSTAIKYESSVSRFGRMFVGKYKIERNDKTDKEGEMVVAECEQLYIELKQTYN
ncbi:hypothetical protein HK098_005024 [Nowakowskiella sp. JEL0407]|nr:hypothetical protein HK098_005024 [Nowakowskiella sp. JEL0407]